MKNRNKILAGLLIVAGAFLFWWSSTRQAVSPVQESFQGNIDGRPNSNVILITLDTTRADHVGCYGGPEGITPNIDKRLAAKGIRFTQASAVAPITLPSHTSMLTGLYPYHHGVRSNGSFALGKDFQTLAGTFHQAGYQTAAFISASVLIRRYGLAREFDFYDDDLSKVSQHIGGLVPSRTGNFTMDSALRWFRARDRAKPFFCWIHLYDPHAPLVPPPEFAARFKGDLYSAEIAFADYQVGRLLDELEAEKLTDTTYLSLLADHGEALGEHEETSHGILIHEATIHIPWLIRGPGIPAGAVLQTPVSNADNAPILAALTGIETPNKEFQDGINILAPENLLPEVGKNREVIIESLLPRYQYGWSPLYALRKGGWKFISGRKDELFDLEKDPRELKDRSGEQSELLKEFRVDLEPVIKIGSKKDSRISLSSGEREQLEALGYLGSESAERPDAPDPRDVIGAHVNLEYAINLLSSGRLDEAMSALNKALKLDPTNVLVLNQRAQIFLRRKQYAEGREDLLRSISLDPKGADAYQFLAHLELSQKNFKKVLELVEIGARSRGAFETFIPIKAQALIGMGRKNEAREILRKHLKNNPEDTDLLGEQAHQAMILDHNPTEAEKILRRAMKVDTLSAKIRFQLADVLRAQGRDEEAREIVKSILKTEPGNARALAILGRLQLDLDPASSIPYLEEAVRMAPEDPKKLTALGVAYIKARRLQDAEALLRKATGLDPSNPEIRNNLAILLIQQEKYSEAIEQLQTILRAHPSFVQGRNNLAIAYSAAGDLKKAESEAREAIKREPDFVDAKMTLASLFRRQKKWEEEYRLLKGLNPRLRSTMDIAIPLAFAAYRTGHCDETLNLLAPSLKRRDRLGWNIELVLGHCMEAEGRSTEALHHFEEASRLSPPGPGRAEAQQGVQRLSMALGEGN